MKNSHSTITTKYLPATNTRSARVRASFRDWKFTIDWDYKVDMLDNHRAAAIAVLKIAEKGGHPMPSELYYGSHDIGYYFVFPCNNTKL